MSLVAAYSDSESGSDSEESIVSSKPPVKSEINSDKNESSKIDTNLRKEDTSKDLIGSSVDDIVDDDEVVNNNKEQTGLFSILPQPKSKFAAIEEDIDDEFIKKKVYSSEEIKPPKKSSKKGSKKQPVKILIPSLEELGDDSDSDTDDKPKDKEKPTIKKKTTLFSMLPKPKHSVTVGMNRNKVFSHAANRPLIPHTLTKKKDDKKVEAKKSKQENNEPKKSRPSLVAELSDSEEDDDSDTTNFFSLSNDTSNSSVSNLKTIPEIDVNTTNTAIRNTVSNEKTLNSKTVDNKHSVEESMKVESKKQSAVVVDENKKGNTFFASLFKNPKSSTTSENKPSNNKLSSDDNKTSINAKCSATNMSSSISDTLGSASKRAKISTNPDVSAPYSDVTAPYGEVTAPYSNVTAPYGNVTAPYGNVTVPYGNVTAPYGNVTAPYSEVTAPYGSSSYAASANDAASNQQKQGKAYPTSPNFFSYAYHKNDPTDQPMGTESTTEIDHYNRPNEDLPIDRDALRALQGNKRRKEEINLIDVRADDIQANRQDYLKNLTTESAEQHKLMVAQKEKDQPTSSQKRKHHITYLAHQAKERELQLQQAWAESAASKRQTQSKYGF